MATAYDTLTKRRAAADTSITMRLPAQTRDLIDTAAAAVGKSRTEFMVESARLHATDVLLDQRLFQLDPEQSAAFAKMLANPPPPSDDLRKLMASQPSWA